MPAGSCQGWQGWAGERGDPSQTGKGEAVVWGAGGYGMNSHSVWVTLGRGAWGHRPGMLGEHCLGTLTPGGGRAWWAQPSEWPASRASCWLLAPPSTSWDAAAAYERAGLGVCGWWGAAHAPHKVMIYLIIDGAWIWWKNVIIILRIRKLLTSVSKKLEFEFKKSSSKLGLIQE